MCENSVICHPDTRFKGRLTTSVAGSAATNTLQLSTPSGLGLTSESYLIQHHIPSQGGPHLMIGRCRYIKSWLPFSNSDNSEGTFYLQSFLWDQLSIDLHQCLTFSFVHCYFLSLLSSSVNSEFPS